MSNNGSTMNLESVATTPSPRSNRLRVVKPSRQNRAAVSNRSTILAGVDGRTPEARRFRDLVLAYSEDLGGFEALSEDAAALVKQAATVTMQTEAMQGAATRGEAVDAEQLVRLSNVLARLLKALHGRRKPKKAPSLAERLTGKSVA
jgi:hypothetical protein